MNKSSKLIHILASARWRRALLRHGVAAAVEHACALRTLKLETIVDLGANRGQFSLLARSLFPEVAILAFEPLPNPIGKYRKVFGNDARVTLYTVAVGSTEEEKKIHVSARDDCSSLFPITDEQLRIFPGTQEVETLMVSVAPLSRVISDSAIVRPALLKLDVQGYELEALRGCESLLLCFEHIYCECSFLEMYSGQPLAGEIVCWLKDRGFELKGMFNNSYDAQGRSVQADLLFSQVDLNSSGRPLSDK